MELEPIEQLYLNYLDMTAHIPGERSCPTLEEYKKSRAFVQGMLAETDAERVIKAEAERIEDER